MQKEGDETTPLSVQHYNIINQTRLTLRNANFNNSGPNNQQRARSAQIKTIQKFIGRLRTDNKNYEAILSEMEGLNLSKYLEEISALIALCVNEKEIRFYTDVATRLNQEYEGIPSMLQKDLLKQFANLYESPQDNKSKLKSILLFITELFVCGFPFPYKQINEMLKKLVKAGTKKRSSFSTQKELRLFAYYYNSDTYSSFLIQFGTIFTTSKAKWIEKWESEGKVVAPYPSMIPAKVREDLTNIFFTNYISSCCKVLSEAFDRLKQIQDELRQNLRMSGQFNKQQQANYNQLKQKFIFTKKQLELVIEAMNSTVTIRQYQLELVEVDQIMKKYINKVENVDIFENQFERQLYNQLPDLCKTQNKAATQQDYKSFKEKLDACKNKSQSDEVVKAFQTINCKRTRRLLAKDILQYRKQYQLVTPFLCRIGAIVATNYKDLVEWMLQALFAEYQKLRQNINTNFVVNDKRSRNLKYLCQFTKFKIIEPDRMLTVIQNLVDDLKGYNIQLLIAALESVGRFLYLAPQHANKFTFLLSKLQNVMKQKSFPLFTTSQLFNSINLLKPHLQPVKPQTVPPTAIQIQAEEIMKKDVINQIDDIISGIKKIVKKQDGMKAIEKSIIRQISEYDFLGNYNYAYLLNELDLEEIIDYVIQKTIENLEQAITTGDYQKCLLWSRFFGQLFKYELIKRSFLFEQLLKFIKKYQGQISVINLVCTALQTCESYLDSKRIPVRNQRFLFLIEFKKYIHKCLYIPMLQQFKIIDVFDYFEPNLASIKLQTLKNFMEEVQENLNNKEFDLSKSLDQYLDKKKLKVDKKEEKKQLKDIRIYQKQIQSEQNSEEKNSELLLTEGKAFDNQFLNIMNSHIKDMSGRIAKPAFVQKVIEKKRERKKVGQGQQKKTIIGRCGAKFVKKQVVFQSETPKKQSQADNLQK